MHRGHGEVASSARAIDVGGNFLRSSRVKSVSAQDELERVIPAIEGIRGELPEICISIDTRRAEVARRALESGADMVNDVSAIGDPEMVDVLVI